MRAILSHLLADCKSTAVYLSLSPRLQQFKQAREYSCLCLYAEPIDWSKAEHKSTISSCCIKGKAHSQREKWSSDCVRSSPQHCMGQSGSDKVLTWILCLVLGAALRDAYRLRRENPRPLVRMIRALNNISL